MYHLDLLPELFGDAISVVDGQRTVFRPAAIAMPAHAAAPDAADFPD